MQDKRRNKATSTHHFVLGSVLLKVVLSEVGGIVAKLTKHSIPLWSNKLVSWHVPVVWHCEQAEAVAKVRQERGWG